MSAPKNKRLRKDADHVAYRQVAVRGVRMAYPQAPTREIARALGLTRHSVRHYLLGDIKSGFTRAPKWVGTFYDGCRRLARDPGRAADVFDRLAKMLAGEAKDK